MPKKCFLSNPKFSKKPEIYKVGTLRKEGNTEIKRSESAESKQHHSNVPLGIIRWLYSSGLMFNTLYGYRMIF